MKTLNVDLDSRSYPIYIGYRLLDRLGEYLREHSITNDVHIVTDENVSALLGERVSSVLEDAGLDAPILVVPAGEGSKSFERADQLYTELITRGATRHATIIAFGGGVVGDLAGFIAATYLRGVKLVQLPTTVIAQVDSSVGGKVGVNHRLGKNLIGAFRQPVFVLIDPDVLLTLPERQIRSGIAEVVKYSLIHGSVFFKLLEDRITEITQLQNTELVESVLETCCQIKSEIVSQDELESGLRAILNFGHTIGHALEAATEYDLLHGEAIMHGLRGAIYLSERVCNLNKDRARRALALIDDLRPPAIPETVDTTAVLNTMQRDKKRTPTGQLWVLLKEIGEPVLTQKVSPQQLQRAVEFVLGR